MVEAHGLALDRARRAALRPGPGTRGRAGEPLVIKRDYL